MDKTKNPRRAHGAGSLEDVESKGDSSLAIQYESAAMLNYIDECPWRFFPHSLPTMLLIVQDLGLRNAQTIHAF
jgi:hypothetical protein